MKKHLFSYLLKSHLTKRIMMLLSVSLLMPVISQAGNWPQSGLTTSATYHVYSAGDGYKFRINDNPTVFDGLGWLSVQGGATVNFIFHTTKPIGVTGGIKVDQGTLNMSLASDYNVPAGQPTLVRWTQQAMFHLCNATANVENAKLNITGLPNKQFIIDGAANITYSGSNESGWTMTNTGTVSKNPLVLLQGGKANLNYVDLRNNWYYLDGGTDGSAINIQSQSFSDYSFDPAYIWYCHSETVLTMNNANISKCAARRWGAAVFASGPKVNGHISSIEMTDCTVTECCILHDGSTTSGPGGMIRPHALSHCSLKMTRCSVLNNKSRHVCGGVHWEAGMVPPMEMTDCVIESNYCMAGGGGAYLQAPAILRGCKIRNNYSLGNGGGIQITTFGGPATNFLPTNYIPADATITLDENTEIIGNHSNTNGGGLSINVNAMNLAYGYGSEPAATAWCVFKNNKGWQYKINVEVNGATLSNNSANAFGGGVFMQRTTDIYQTNVRLNWGRIENNTAGMHGGASFIQSNIDENFYYGTCPYTSYPDSLNMWVEIGSTRADSLVFVSNRATSGGGMYVSVNHNPLHTSSKLFVNINQNGFVGLEGKPNIANGGNGGGVYVSGGNVMVKGGNVTYNKANKSGNNGGNGGGFYVTGGQVEVKGGTILNNIAQADGGGFYVNVADSNIETKINSSMAATTISGNQAVNGGGSYVNQGQLIIQGNATNIATNTASMAGGGIYLGTGNVTITDATLNGNVSQGSHGGGFYVANGSFTANNAAITTNHAPNGNGGGVYAGGANGHVMLNAGTRVNDNNAINGGGICVDGGNLTFTNATMTGNEATADGGGFYTTGGLVQISGNSAEISSNSAATNGGGMYIGGNINLQGGTISENVAGTRGGGVYVAEGGRFDMTGGTIGGTTAQGNLTTANPSYGGGLYMGGGTATLTGGSISGNTATLTGGYGGGIYMEGGSCTLSGGSIIGGTSSSYANIAKYGGGIYSAGGTIRVKGGHISYNQAENGGGIYSYGENPKVYVEKEVSGKTEALSYIEYNTADNGGGIYARRGEVYFSDGFIQHNMANKYGGGMYVDTEGMLYLTGNAVLSRNHVPGSTDDSTDGGGVYLLGTVKVGEEGATGSILADDNYKGASYTYPATNNRNNIFLPDPVATSYTSDTHRSVVWVVQGGITETSHVGFSVRHNHLPVIYCDRSADPSAPEGSWTYLDRFKTGLGHDLNTRLFDDTGLYRVVHITNNTAYFDPDHVYLYGFWPEVVNELSDVPAGGFIEDGNTVTIRNKEGLAWLISYVNGYNDCDSHNSADLVVNLEADVNMKDFGWVPMGFKGESGSTPAPFCGTFNGNGHTIEGINVLVYGEGPQGFLDYGLFGYVSGGNIHDVFLKGARYSLDEYESLVLGAIAGETDNGATISNSEVQSTLVTQNPAATIGGLVGRSAAGSTIHSCIGIADITGGTMGGLVGENNGNLYNSFSNVKFTYMDDASQYYGGLVAVNYGTVENCYVRIRPEDDNPSGNFGFLVGDNKGEYGDVRFCYAPWNKTPFWANNEGRFQGYGNYGESELPFLYCHRDTQVSLANSNNGYVPTGENVDKQMLIALNKWVAQDSLHRVTYTTWGRPWQESEDNKPLNDDYPILKMPLNDAVAAKTDDPYLYYGLLDTLLVKYNEADEAIWKYRTTTDTVKGVNADTTSRLYIAEDVVLINKNPLKAYVGITLDNSAGAAGANPEGGVATEGMTDATDWHMISTPLMDAPLGIDYNGDEASHGFSMGHPSDMPYYLFYPKESPLHGYFPSHRFGEEYPANDQNITADNNQGNYYQEWDFYSYDEPQFHWINFKRNSASHWHMDDPAHLEGISYTNEPKLVRGKGYLAATREETFLQCYGTLNNGGVDYGLTQTWGVPRYGYNLIGNPYQAYLDFNAFAVANVNDVDAIWDSLSTASYTVMDEDLGDYVTFSYDASNNPAYAGRYIHPHQGFFVLLRDREAANAHFEPVMRNVTAEDVKFRDMERPNYPLVNLYVKEANGLGDRVTVELGRPDEGGAPLMKGLRTGNGKIWCRYNEEDWAIAYTQPGISEVSIRFESVEDTEYTLRWDTYNGEFSYLHLIDNIMGADVDCLSESEYRFSSRTSDYTSRFRLVFGYTGIEEDTEAETMQDFAFMMGDELVVTGEGVLQVFDVNGRLVASRELHGVQSTVAMSEVANGVYVLRLTEGKQSRVQKMVISK